MAVQVDIDFEILEGSLPDVHDASEFKEHIEHELSTILNRVLFPGMDRIHHQIRYKYENVRVRIT